MSSFESLPDELHYAIGEMMEDDVASLSRLVRTSKRHRDIQHERLERLRIKEEKNFAYTLMLLLPLMMDADWEQDIDINMALAWNVWRRQGRDPKLRKLLELVEKVIGQPPHTRLGEILDTESVRPSVLKVTKRSGTAEHAMEKSFPAGTPMRTFALSIVSVPGRGTTLDIEWL